MMKMINGQTHGLFVLDAEPKELSIVLILGPVKMEDLGKLSGMAGLGGSLGPLAGVQHTPKPDGKDKDKTKPPKAKSGGEE